MSVCTRAATNNACVLEMNHLLMYIVNNAPLSGKYTVERHAEQIDHYHRSSRLLVCLERNKVVRARRLEAII
jgi:hypothetical protein